jgi:NAD(P)-dependent dehydrogenase (short-subunit alcohol dehydrogenase family)
MADLRNKVAIVTGGGQGIGRGVALALASAGASVVVAERNGETREATCDEIRSRGAESVGVDCDVRESADLERCIEETVERFGGLDILINNAQMWHNTLLLDATDEDMELTFSSGPLAVFRSMRLAHPHLKQRRGVIVNVGSSGAIMHDGRALAVYSAAKNATESLTRYAAVEWGSDGIRVLLIMPAAASPALAQWRTAEPDLVAEMESRIPIGRFGDPEHDIGRPVAWLCSDEAGYMTGSIVMLDGGQMFTR